MNKSIFSIAYLEYMHRVLNKDIVDSYIPMFCTCLLKQSGDIVDSTALKQSMLDTYGISNLTAGAVDSICNRMISKEILYKSHGQIFINRDKLCQYEVSLNKDDRILADYDRLVAEIAEYSKNLPKEYSQAEVSNGLLQFLDKHDVDILLQHNTEIFQKITKYEDSRLAYVISRYVLDSEEKGGDALNILSRLSKGNAITNLVCFSGLSAYSGKLNDLTIYIDTPFFYNLLGANSISNKESAEELMEILQKNGAKFAMFRHNYNEVCTNLDDVIYRLQTGTYDLRRSSRLLKTALREQYTPMQMQAILNNVDVIRDKWGIDIPENPDMPNGYFDIDVVKLEQIITDRYTQQHSRELFYHEMNMLSIDVDSIVFTYRLRGNTMARTLKSSKAIFLTTNKVIANASNSPEISTLRHHIPVCTTDMFLSAILWTNFPRESEQLNRKMLISECFNTIKLDDSLLARFFEDVKEKRLAENISENQYLALTTSHLSLSLLGDKTLNDINAYTDRTANEILEILEQEHKDEINAIREENRINREVVTKKKDDEISELKATHSNEIAEKDKTIAALNDTVDFVERWCKRDAKRWSNFISLFILIFIASLFIVKTYVPKDFFDKHKSISCIWSIVNFILTIWAVLNWSGCIPKFVDLKSTIYKVLYKRLVRRRLNKQI